MQEIQVGHHIGRVTDYGISETQSGRPQVFVNFDVEFNDPISKEKYTKNMTWYGHLTEKSLEITLTALCIALNMLGDDPSILAGGYENGAIQLNREALLDIVEEEYNGKITKKIKWVNAVGTGRNIKRMTSAEAKAKLSMLNLKNKIAEIKIKNGANDIEF